MKLDEKELMSKRKMSKKDKAFAKKMDTHILEFDKLRKFVNKNLGKLPDEALEAFADHVDKTLKVVEKIACPKKK